MGNRAVIAFKNDPNATGIYLHWNGDPESVLAFCHAAKKMGARNPGSDDSYAMAGLCRAVTLFMHDSPRELTSMGVGPLTTLDTDNYDNGLYIIGGDWNITERHYTDDRTMTEADFDDRQITVYNNIQTDIIARHLSIVKEAANTLP